jgi:hypothetical protein
MAMLYENYLSSGFIHSPTKADPRRGLAELVLYNPTSEPCEATLTVYFGDREPRTLPPESVGPETNTLLVMPRLAPEVFTDCGFWGTKVLSTTPLILNFINAIRIMDDKPRFRGGTTNFHGTKLHKQWHFPDGVWLDWNRSTQGDIGRATAPFNKMDYIYFLNPNPQDAEIEMTLQYRHLEPTSVHLTVQAERVSVWKNVGNVPYNQPYAAKIISTEPVSASAVRYVYGLHGLEEWGMQVHCSMYGVPGPITG